MNDLWGLFDSILTKHGSWALMTLALAYVVRKLYRRNTELQDMVLKLAGDNYNVLKSILESKQGKGE